MVVVDELYRLSLPYRSHLPFLFTRDYLTAQNILILDDRLPQITAIID